MAEKFIYIPKDDTQINYICLLQLVVETFELDQSNFFKPTNNYYKTLGTSVINIPMPPPSLV